MTWTLAAAGVATAGLCVCAAGWAVAGRGAWRVVGAHMRRNLQAAVSYRLRLAMSGLNLAVFAVLAVLVARGLLLPVLGDTIRGAAASSVSYLVVGLAAWPAAWAGYQSSSTTLRREQMMGTLEVLEATPAGVQAIPFASLVTQGAMSLAVAAATMAFLAALVPFGLRPTLAGSALAIAALALAALFLWGAGLLVGALTALHKDVGGVDSLLRVFLVILSGAYIPLSVLPGGMQVAAAAFPLSAGFQLVRDALGGTADAWPTVARLGYLAGACLLVAAVGARTLRWSLARARRNGGLQGY